MTTRDVFVTGGDALDASTFSMHVAGCDTLLQLVGTPHPSPSKAAEFERVDLVSARESCRAANAANIAHCIYTQRRTARALRGTTGSW